MYINMFPYIGAAVFIFLKHTNCITPQIRISQQAQVMSRYGNLTILSYREVHFYDKSQGLSMYTCINFIYAGTLSTHYDVIYYH